MILEPCASHPISALCACLDSIKPTPCVWGASVSSCLEYSNSSPVISLLCPACVHLVSLMPSKIRLLFFISAATCLVLPVSYMVLMFHVPMCVLLVERIGSVASFRLSPPSVMRPRIVEDLPTSRKLVSVSLFGVSVAVRVFPGWGC